MILPDLVIFTISVISTGIILHLHFIYQAILIELNILNNLKGDTTHFGVIKTVRILKTAFYL